MLRTADLHSRRFGALRRRNGQALATWLSDIATTGLAHALALAHPQIRASLSGHAVV
jgi:hypothetical protein